MKVLKTFLLLVCIIYSGSVSAQISYGIRPYYIGLDKPYNYLFNSPVGIEAIAKAGDLDGHFKFGAAIGYYKLNPTQDTFHNFTLKEVSSSTELLPSYNVVQDYSVVNIGILIEYKIMNHALSPVIGLDVYGNMIRYKYINYISTLLYSEEDQTYGTISILPRVGLTYEMNEKWIFSASIARNIYNIGFGDISIPTYWKTSIAVSYYFE